MVRRLAVAAVACCTVAVLVGAAPSSVGAVPGGMRGVPGDLKVVQMDPDPTPAGELTTVHAIVSNEGPVKSDGFVMTVTLPEGTRPQGPYFPSHCAVVAQRVVRCEFPKGLPPGQTATALIPARIDAGATGVLDGGEVAVAGAGDPNAENDSAEFEIQVTDAG